MGINKTPHCVYKYVVDGQIIYIGKTDSDLINRINCHEKEDKFQDYFGKWDIYCTPLSNHVETNYFEGFLINKYKPILNDLDNEPGVCNIDIIEPEWFSLNDYITNYYTKKNKTEISNFSNTKREITKLKNKITKAKNKYNFEKLKWKTIIKKRNSIALRIFKNELANERWRDLIDKIRKGFTDEELIKEKEKENNDDGYKFIYSYKMWYDRSINHKGNTITVVVNTIETECKNLWYNLLPHNIYDVLPLLEEYLEEDEEGKKLSDKYDKYTEQIEIQNVLMEECEKEIKQYDDLISLLETQF